MSKSIKLSWILPIVQLALAVVLLKWPFRMPQVDTLYQPTARLIAYGVSAPALYVQVLSPLCDKIDQVLPGLLGFGAHELAFLLGVIIVWFLVGRSWDRHRCRPTYTRGRRPGWKTFITNLCLILLGLPFLVGGIHDLRTLGQLNNDWGNYVESALYLVWGLALFVFPGIALVGAIRGTKVARSSG